MTIDDATFRRLTEPHRRELQAHCYRMLGSLQDAEDLVQETLLAAWRGLEGFEERSSLRTWLYRIATNRCLNALRTRERRPRETDFPVPEPTRRSDTPWLQPYPDALLDPAPAPHARYETREAISLAFVTALQRLPARQRAALVLRDVLGFRGAEAAGMLDTTEDAVASALKRAREGLDGRLAPERAPLPDSPRERELAGRFADAFEGGEIDAVVALLTDDAWLTMPPLPYEYQGRAAIAGFLSGPVFRDRGFALRPTRANGQPAFAAYLGDQPHMLVALALTSDGISQVTTFIDGALVARFPDL